MQIRDQTLSMFFLLQDPNKLAAKSGDSPVIWWPWSRHLIQKDSKSETLHQVDLENSVRCFFKVQTCSSALSLEEISSSEPSGCTITTWGTSPSFPALMSSRILRWRVPLAAGAAAAAGDASSELLVWLFESSLWTAARVLLEAELCRGIDLKVGRSLWSLLESSSVCGAKEENWLRFCCSTS